MNQHLTHVLDACVIGVTTLATLASSVVLNEAPQARPQPEAVALAARALTEALTGRMETRDQLLPSPEVMAQQEQRGRTDQLCELFFNNP